MTLAAVIVLLFVSHPAADEPKTASDFYGRGFDWYQKKDYDKAIKDFSEAIRLDPKQTLYYLFRSLCWEETKEYDKALNDLDQAMQVDPTTTSLSGRGRLWLAKKDYEKAIDNYSKSFEEQSKKVMRSGGRLFLTPDQQSLIPIDCEQLAWIYSSCPDDKFRDGKKAVEWARKSLEYSGTRSYWRLHEALAAAYAETGDFDQALAEQKKAYDMLMKVRMPKTGEPDVEAIKKAVERIKLYREKKPYRLASGENQKYRSAEGKFAVRFPPGFKVETTTQKTDGADMQLFEVNEARKQYMLLYTDLPEEVVKNVEAKKIFDGGQEGSVNKNGGKINSSKDFSFGKDKFPARETMISMDKQHLHLRMVLAGPRLYVFSVGGPEDHLSAKDAAEFLDSFEITR